MKVFTKLEEFLAANSKKAYEGAAAAQPAPDVKPEKAEPAVKPGPAANPKPATAPQMPMSGGAAQPAPAIQPGKADPEVKPGPSRPTPTPKREEPSPIRRTKPSVIPKPKAKASEVVDRFLMELKKAKAPIKFDISKLKNKYQND